jgi:hypothetical protein
VTLFSGAPRRRRGQRRLTEAEGLCIEMHSEPCTCAFRNEAEAREAFLAHRAEFDRPSNAGTCQPWAIRFGFATEQQLDWYRRVTRDPRKAFKN